MLFYDNCDVITVNIILEGCNVSHCTHPIGINQETSLISTQTCQGSGWGGGVTGDKKERLLLSRKERKISCPSPQCGVASVSEVGPQPSSLPGKTQITSRAL